MKYTLEIEINKPIDEVVALFDNPENMKQWMEGLQSFETFEGISGKPGAKSKLVFQMGKRRMEMIETILTRNLPEEFSGTYEMNGVLNIIRNKFVKLSDSKTKYITENEFQMSGMMKVFGWLFPGMFKKQSYKYLEAFKKFAESV